MRKHRDLQFKIFVERLTELNYYLPLLLGLIAAKNIDPKDLNKIIIHAVPNSWAWQSYVQGWDLEERSYKETCNMFEGMEISEAIYDGGATY